MKGSDFQNDTSPHYSEPRQKFSPFQIKKMKGVIMPENIFDEIRNRVSIEDVAKFYGLNMSHSGMACCPFHDDRTPSLKVYDDHFYCFGCGATGDCTGFTAKLFGLTQIQAAKKISYDFGLRLFKDGIAVPINRIVKSENKCRMWLKEAEQTITEYLFLLNRWRKVYAPKNQTEELHPLFVECLHKTDYMEYLYDLITRGTPEEKKELFDLSQEEIEQIKERVEKFAANQRSVKRKAI